MSDPSDPSDKYQKIPRNPVVLVHGIDDSAVSMRHIADYLTTRGWAVSSLSLTPGDGRAGIPELAGQLTAHIDAAYPPGQRLDLVGFSLGGIVCRYFLQRMDGLQRAQRLVTISSPHHGTLAAWLRRNTGCRQLRANSPFITDLNSDLDVLRQLDVTSIWTPYDLVIIPPGSSRLPLGREVKLPILLHPWMLRDPRSLAAVAEALKK